MWRRALSCALSLLVTLGGPVSAEPADPTLGLKAEAGLQSAEELSPYLRAELSYLLSQTWVVQSSLMGALSGPSRLNAALGARAQLDVFHYIPWLGLSLSAPLSSTLSSPPSLGLELGFDRKLSPTQALSLSARAPGLSAGELDWSLGVSWRYDWLLFDPFGESSW